MNENCASDNCMVQIGPFCLWVHRSELNAPDEKSWDNWGNGFGAQHWSRIKTCFHRREAEIQNLPKMKSKTEIGLQSSNVWVDLMIIYWPAGDSIHILGSNAILRQFNAIFTSLFALRSLYCLNEIVINIFIHFICYVNLHEMQEQEWNFVQIRKLKWRIKAAVFLTVFFLSKKRPTNKWT